MGVELRCIRVEIPTISIMKMEMGMRQPIFILLSGSETLSEVKKTIFNTVWNALLPSIWRHGSPSDVILKCDQEEICSDEQLHQRLLLSRCFQATFNGRNASDRKNIVQ